MHSPLLFFFFFNDTATTEIYTLSLHDALPISGSHEGRGAGHSHVRHRQEHRQRRGRRSHGRRHAVSHVRPEAEGIAGGEISQLNAPSFQRKARSSRKILRASWYASGSMGPSLADCPASSRSSVNAVFRD